MLVISPAFKTRPTVNTFNCAIRNLIPMFLDLWFWGAANELAPLRRSNLRGKLRGVPCSIAEI